MANPFSLKNACKELGKAFCLLISGLRRMQRILQDLSLIVNQGIYLPVDWHDNLEEFYFATKL